MRGISGYEFLLTFFTSQGAICLDTLGVAWSPVLTIKSALLSLQSLLSSPEPKDPQDAEVAGMLMRDPERFDQVAREWAVKYAGAPPRRRDDSAAPRHTPATAKPTKSKEAELREQIARYGNIFFFHIKLSVLICPYAYDI